MTNFHFFITYLQYRAYEANIFVELADNGFSGCISVVGADARRWGRFGGICGRLSTL